MFLEHNGDINFSFGTLTFYNGIMELLRMKCLHLFFTNDTRLLGRNGCWIVSVSA